MGLGMVMKRTLLILLVDLVVILVPLMLGGGILFVGLFNAGHHQLDPRALYPP